MDQTQARAALPPSLPVLDAWLVPERRLDGITRARLRRASRRPAKFHATLRQAGAEVAGTMDFPDHHRFTRRELAAVHARAVALGAVPITTPKDAVRLPPAWRADLQVLGVQLAWADEAALERLLAEVLA